MRRLTCLLHHLSARDAAGRWQPGGLASAKSGHGPNYSGTANSPSSDQSSCVDGHVDDPRRLDQVLRQGLLRRP